jgi:hypothetical protein
LAFSADGVPDSDVAVRVVEAKIFIRPVGSSLSRRVPRNLQDAHIFFEGTEFNFADLPDHMLEGSGRF